MKHIQWLLLSFNKTGTQILRKINLKPACICHGLATVRTSGNALNDCGWKWGLTSLLGQPFHKNNLYINSFVWSPRSPRSLVNELLLSCVFTKFFRTVSRTLWNKSGRLHILSTSTICHWLLLVFPKFECLISNVSHTCVYLTFNLWKQETTTNDHKPSENDHKSPANNRKQLNKPLPNSNYLIFVNWKQDGVWQM